MRTSHAVSQGRIWTHYEQPDAANTEGTLTPVAHPAAPRQLAVGKRVLGPPVAQAATVVVGANLPRGSSQGMSCPCTLSSACEVLRSGELTRLQAATAAALATYNQAI